VGETDEAMRTIVSPAAPNVAHGSDRSASELRRDETQVDSVNLLGVRVSAINIPTALARIHEATREGRKGYICIRDAHGLVKFQNDRDLCAVHNHTFLVTPDGMPLVWSLRHLGKRQANRVYGPDLMLALFDHGRNLGLRHFLYGATAECVQKLKQRLSEMAPGAIVTGCYSPPFRALSSNEEANVAEMINATEADVVWVGLSTPKQEFWMARMRERLSAPMLIRVGAAFDFHAGLKRQAPRFVERSGFEWLFRMITEPRRLAKRYAITVPSFIVLIYSQFCRLRAFPLHEPTDFAGVRQGAAVATEN
jgi:N-acetylglucosaminyldiphosphoundecaprenol N-acetyl-beta-D-mannosaminyltransferase